MILMIVVVAEMQIEVMAQFRPEGGGGDDDRGGEVGGDSGGIGGEGGSKGDGGGGGDIDGEGVVEMMKSGDNDRRMKIF